MTMILANASLSDAGVITGPIGLGDLPLSNLQRPSLQEPYRCNAGTDVVLVVDLLSPQAINFAALIGHTCDAAATCVVSAGSTIAASDFTLGSFPMQSQLEAGGSPPSLPKNLFFQTFAPQTYRYWKFTITAPGATTLDFGRLYVSNAFQPTYNMVFGMNQGFQDLSSEFVTLSGDSISQTRPKRKVHEFSLEDLTEDEAFAQLLATDYVIGTNTDVLFIPFPDDKKYVQLNSIYGKVSEMTPIGWTSWQRFRKQYRIVELPS